MKKKLIYLFCLLFIISCSPSKRELFKTTDEFVLSLETTYDSYGLLNGREHAITTSDGLFTITPIGRLINVKIEKVVDDEEYEQLREDLAKHYKDDSRVNDVYICGAGTIMIDCRN